MEIAQTFHGDDTGFSWMEMKQISLGNHLSSFGNKTGFL